MHYYCIKTHSYVIILFSADYMDWHRLMSTIMFETNLSMGGSFFLYSDFLQTEPLINRSCILSNFE